MEYVPQSKLKAWREENTPDICPICSLPSKDWVVDHDHQSGMIRGVIDREMNVFLGRIENAYKRLSKGKKATPLADTLKGVLGYLEAPESGILHPVGLTQLCKRFKNLTATEQVKILKAKKATKSSLKACTNSKSRTDLYRSLIKNICL